MKLDKLTRIQAREINQVFKFLAGIIQSKQQAIIYIDIFKIKLAMFMFLQMNIKQTGITE